MSRNIIAHFQVKCQDHMRLNGLPCEKELIFDGSIQRYSADDNQQKEDEWYIGNIESLSCGLVCTCTYGSWSSPDKYTYRSIDDYEGDMSEAKKELVEKKISSIEKKERDKRLLHDKVAKEVTTLYRGPKKGNSKMNLLPLRDGDDKYLKTKGIIQHENSFWPLKFSWYRDSKTFKRYRALTIPIINIDNKLRSLQYIFYMDGQCVKRLHACGEKKGNFYFIGSPREFNPLVDLWSEHKNQPDIKRIYIAEGYATAASLYNTLVDIYSSKDFFVVVAIDAGNIVPVVGNLRTKFATQEITICADDDEAGHHSADEACKFYNCIKYK